MKENRGGFPIGVILLLLGGGYWFYRKSPQEIPQIPVMTKQAEAPRSNPSLPFHTSLTNRQGKTISVVVLGRSATELQIRRTDDPKNSLFKVPISSLRDEDRRIVESLPINSQKDTSELAILEKRLRQVEQKVESLAKAKNEAGSLKTEEWRRATLKEITEGTKEALKLEARIESLKAEP